MDNLLPIKLQEKLPKLYAQEHEADPIAYVKYFLPGTAWTWYALEYDKNDIFFGYVVSGIDYPELGYFSLSELRNVHKVAKLFWGVERDLSFRPTKLSVIKEQYGN